MLLLTTCLKRRIVVIRTPHVSVEQTWRESSSEDSSGTSNRKVLTGGRWTLLSPTPSSSPATSPPPFPSSPPASFPERLPDLDARWKRSCDACTGTASWKTYRALTEKFRMICSWAVSEGSKGRGTRRSGGREGREGSTGSTLGQLRDGRITTEIQSFLVACPSLGWALGAFKVVPSTCASEFFLTAEIYFSVEYDARLCFMI